MTDWREAIQLDGSGIVRKNGRIARGEGSQIAGVALLGTAGLLCVAGIVLVVLVDADASGSRATAISALGALGSAAVGGIAGMLTGRTSGSGGTVPPAGNGVGGDGAGGGAAGGPAPAAGDAAATGGAAGTALAAAPQEGQPTAVGAQTDADFVFEGIPPIEQTDG